MRVIWACVAGVIMVLLEILGLWLHRKFPKRDVLIAAILSILGGLTFFGQAWIAVNARR